MEPLVEVNGISELDIALKCGAKFIGVNNRNLKTFEVDPKTTDKVCKQLKDRKKEVVVAALSGIKTASDVQGYLDAGCKAVLVGESLMRVSDPASLVKELSLRGPLTKVVG